MKLFIQPMDSVLCLDASTVLCSGHKQILAVSLPTGEVIHKLHQDVAHITFMMEHSNNLYCSTSNGCIRVFPVKHNISSMQLASTHWGHSKAVPSILWCLPPFPPGSACFHHGIVG